MGTILSDSGIFSPSQVIFLFWTCYHIYFLDGKYSVSIPLITTHVLKPDNSR